MFKLRSASSRAGFITAVVLLLANILLVTTAYSKSSLVTFSLGQTGLAVDNDKLLVAFRLNNTSDRNAYRVPSRMWLELWVA